MIFIWVFLSLLVHCSDLKERLDLLNSQSQHTPIKLDSDSYQLYTQEPRNFTLFVLFTTTMAEHNCQPCREFDVEYSLLAKAWAKSFQPSTLYFGKLDFKDGQEVFRRLEIAAVPLLLRFPPTSGPQAIKTEFDKYDLNENTRDAESIVAFIKSKVGVQLSISRPLDYTKVAITLIALLGALLVIRVFYDHIVFVLTDKKLWTFIALSTIVIMCGGHMWNTIRNPPYVGYDNGKVQLVSGGFSYQFAIESQVVALLYAAVSAMLVGLVTVAPKVADPAKQRTTIILYVIGFVLFYSYLLSYFRTKNPSYPFKLFL